MGQISIALRELHKERQRVQSQLNQLDSAIKALSGNHRRSSGPRRVLSAAARARIAAAQRARWAKWKKVQKAA